MPNWIIFGLAILRYSCPEQTLSTVTQKSTKKVAGATKNDLEVAEMNHQNRYLLVRTVVLGIPKEASNYNPSPIISFVLRSKNDQACSAKPSPVHCRN